MMMMMMMMMMIMTTMTIMLRREAGLATATDSELFFEDKEGRQAKRTSAGEKAKLKKTQLARSKVLKSLASLAKVRGKPWMDRSTPTPRRAALLPCDRATRLSLASLGDKLSFPNANKRSLPTF